MYPLKKEAKKKFNPYFNTAINGIPVRVSIKDMQANPAKYANTPLVNMYEDADSIKERVLKSKKSSARKVNMNNVTRGLIFDKDHKTQKQKAIENFLELQKKKIAKLKSRNEADQEEVGKKKTAAKKTTAKGKKKTAEEIAIENALKEQENQ